MISRIDHVSIAVRDCKRARDFFSTVLGCVPGASATSEELGFFWEILSVGDLSRLELLTPSGENSFLGNFLSDKKDGGVHHITFETPDILKVKQNLEHHQIPYFGFNDDKASWKELFIHPRHAFGVLIQIAEFIPDDWLNPSLVFQQGKKWSAQKTPDGAELTIQHPGGGKASINLTKEEADQLIADLKKTL